MDFNACWAALPTGGLQGLLAGWCGRGGICHQECNRGMESWMGVGDGRGVTGIYRSVIGAQKCNGTSQRCTQAQKCNCGMVRGGNHA